MIRAIIFDCFGVLYVDPSQYFYHQAIPNFDEYKGALHDLHTRYDRGWIDFSDYTAEIAQLTGVELDYIRENIHGEVRLNQELLDYSQQLRETYRIALLSNIGAGGMEAFFTAQQRNELFDAAVLSSDVGYAKPDREIYHLTAERLGVSPAQCLMIDDAESNCAGAEAAGMRAIRFEHTAQVVAAIQREVKNNLT